MSMDSGMFSAEHETSISLAFLMTTPPSVLTPRQFSSLMKFIGLYMQKMAAFKYDGFYHGIHWQSTVTTKTTILA